MCGFEDSRAENYFGREEVSETEMEARVKMLKNGFRERIKSKDDLVIDLVLNYV